MATDPVLAPAARAEGAGAAPSGAAWSAPVGEAPDEQLVLRSRRGDRAAFEELVRRTARAVYARQYLETGDAHRAEDLTQETYLLAWRSIGRLDDPATFRAWLATIARSVASDAYRRESRQKRGGAGKAAAGASDLGAIPDPGAPPDEAAQREERRRRVAGALKSLPEDATDTQASAAFVPMVPDLLALSKCPDFIVNKGHYFGSNLADDDKHALIEFLKTF